ncbi:hypothetical protein BJX62DRAFT_245686 [Aspergillus germanicus]
MSALFLEDQDDTGPVLPYGYKTHVIPITNHTVADSIRTSNTCRRPQPRAYMVFKNYTSVPLPPFFPIIIYFTHPNPNPDPSSLSTQLPSLSALTDNDDNFKPHLDVYLLPGASALDCVSHYTKEQAAGGTCAAHVRAFKRYLAASARAPMRLGLLPPPPTQAQFKLPGMMTSYQEVNAQGLLFICHGRDWRDPDGRMTLDCVDFVLQDLLDSDDDDDDDNDHDRDNKGPDNLNPNSLTMLDDGTRPNDPIKKRTIWPINASSPAVDEAYCDWPMNKWMGESFYYIDDGLKHAWQKASSLGWTHWI